MAVSRRQFVIGGLLAIESRSAAASSVVAADRMHRYNVVWTSPSKNATGVMPVGNGDIAAGVYAIADGDLYLLLAKNDAYTYMGDIFKTGRVRISLTPNPFAQGKAFRQSLDLASGSIHIEAGGVAFRVWADANHPVFHIEIESTSPVSVSAQPEFWTRFDACSYNVTDHYDKSSLLAPGAKPTQDVRLERDGRLLWYFAVGDRSVYPDDLKYYQVEQMAAQFPDPYRFNIFGNLLESPSLKLRDGALRGRGRRFDIRIHALTMQTRRPEIWIQAIIRQARKPVDTRADWDNHRKWWTGFWNRSWIIASDRTAPSELREKLNGEASANGLREEPDGAALVAQSYNVFRFLMACQSRGRVPAKFNGGLFTQQLFVPATDKRKRSGDKQTVEGGWILHEDDRLWGRRSTFQNQRLLYWPLLASGDFDLMKPFFAYYSDLLPMRKAITKAWFGHEGAYYRENIEPTGGERDCGRDGRPDKSEPGQPSSYYHGCYFTSGLETTAMMLDYVVYTTDTSFRDRVLVPFAREVLLFFDRHYRRGADGKLHIDPGQVLETWWRAVKPAPDVAGLRFCLDQLLAIDAGTPEDQAQWRKLRSQIPEVPVQTIDGRKALAPAEKWAQKHNNENGELYPVFPFRCYGVALGSHDLVDWTMRHRTMKDAYHGTCWTQDQIHWAYAGNGSEAARGLVRRFRKASTMCRFPLYGDESPDSCPDFDHFGAGSIALQRMIVQEAGDKIVFLPTWPADWDLDFRLHLTGGAVLTGAIQNGKLLTWNIQPESRRKDVVVCQTQA